MIIIYSFSQSIGTLYPYIVDFEKFGSLHPYMNRIQKMADGYRAYETVPLGFIKRHEEYPVQVDVLAPMKTVRYRSQVKPSVSLEILFEFSTLENKTIITETITINANAIVRWMMENLMQRAHKQLFEKLASV